MPVITHYVRYDAPGASGRQARAVCGQEVNPKREHAAEPSCATCARWVREFETMDIVPSAGGAPVRSTLSNTLDGYQPKGER